MSQALTILQRNLPPFLNASSPNLGVLIQAIDQAFQLLDRYEQERLAELSILEATGAALDRAASRFGLVRQPGETDAHLQQRIAALALPRVSPDSVAYLLSLYGDLPSGTTGSELYEPCGGVLVGWDPSWSFTFDRVPVTPTYTRNSPATGPDGTEEVANSPTWYTLSNSTTWPGIFQATAQLLTNTAFTNVTSGLPTGYTASLVTGDSLSLQSAPSSYPIQGDNVLVWSRSSAVSSGQTTITSPTVPVSASTTYTLSVYLLTSGLSGGYVQLQVVEGSSTTTLAQTGASPTAVRLQGTYTTTASSTGIALQLVFPASAYGSVVLGSPQIEAAPSASEYLRNSSTTSTASRSAATLTLPPSTLPVWGQGTVGMGVYVTPLTEAQPSVLFASPVLTLGWNGSAWYATLAGGPTVSSPGSLGPGPHYVLVRWNDLLSLFDLWIDGSQAASAPISTAPTSSGTVYVGSSTNGSQQINAYVGNITLASASMTDGQVSQWSYAYRTPVYAPTLFQGNFEQQILEGTTGSVYFSSAFSVFLPLVGSQGLGLNPFFLDQSYMDSGYALQGTSSASSTQSRDLVSVLAAGINPYPYTKGRVQ